ncbi:MAG: vWA domain-containing protein [Marmoricola sp.]
MALLDRHLGFLDALRDAGLPASTAEGLDAVRAVSALGLGDREAVRAAYAATLVKRHAHRPAFDRVFDLYFPALVGDGASTALDHPDQLDQPSRLDRPGGAETAGDGPADLATYREQLAEALALGDPDLLAAMAREGVQRFGMIRGRGPGEQRWSSYNVMNRVSPGELVDTVLEGLGLDPGDDLRSDVESQVTRYEELVQGDVARRAAEVRGPEYVARHTVRPSIDQLDFTAARKADLAEMRREIYPLARRLATRVGRRHHHRRGDALDFRRTVRASMSTGGVPLTTHHRPRRPSRTDLVVLCDVSGSVASFASFTLMLVYALREQFSRVRAFTFVDEIHEVTDRFSVAADPAETLTELAASAQYASLWGRTSYGRAFTRFEERYADALTPRTNLLILGDARSNYSDLALPVLRRMTYDARHSWWLNPEHRRHWGTGDSAAREYGALVPMVECRNLTQLGDFVESLA